MRIRQRLTITFTTSIMLIMILFAIAIYYFSSRYRKNEFYARLLQRVEITEKMFLEKENLPESTYELIRAQFLNKLPDETEEVFELNGEADLEKHFSKEFVSNLFENDLAYFEQDSVQGVGKIFHLPTGNYAVILTAQDHAGIKMLEYLRTIIIVTLSSCILIMGVLSYFISISVLNPISKKIQKANAISAKNFHERLTVYNPDDEIGELAIAFNNLLDRVTDVLDSQRSFVHNASHEMRNPLTAIIGEAELALEKQRQTAEYIESFKSISAEANRLSLLVNNLLQMANISYSEVLFKSEILDLRELLIESKQKFDFTCPENKVILKFLLNDSLDTKINIRGNSHLLQTAFINVFDNASKFSYMKDVEVTLKFESDDVVVVKVVDLGVGIPKEDLPKVYRPFHRAPNVRQIAGSGIGIPLTSRIIELHKGSIKIDSVIGEGTTVEISLPLIT